MESVKIHKTAVIDPRAKLGANVSVGPYSVIGHDAVIGDNVEIGSHCVIDGNTSVGKGTRVFTGAILGSIPQDKKFNGDKTVSLVIGENNVIREYVTMNTGTVEGGGKTSVGNNNLFMAYSHVAHDCVVGNNCVMANVGHLAGHVTLEDNTVVGGLSAVHQFVRMGRLSIVGGCSKVVQDIPPFSMCDGHPARVYNLNLVGLRRAKIPHPTIVNLKKAFKILFHSGLTKTNAIAQIQQEVEMSPELEHLVFFAKTTERGLCG